MSLHAFPISREAFSIRIVADAIARLSAEEAAGLWRETAAHLLTVAIERGHDEAEARVEVGRFLDAVQSM